MGCGTKTNIYTGSLLVHKTGDGDEEGEFNNNFSGRLRIPVVLKILNQNLEELSLVSFVIFGLHCNENVLVVYFLSPSL